MIIEISCFTNGVDVLLKIIVFFVLTDCLSLHVQALISLQHYYYILLQYGACKNIAEIDDGLLHHKQVADCRIALKIFWISYALRLWFQERHTGIIRKFSGSLNRVSLVLFVAGVHEFALCAHFS